MDHLWTAVVSFRSELVLLTGFVLAVLATLHILLRKAEVQSAAGWIGLVWFAPITGTVLYFLLGVNRVKRRARYARSARDRGTGDGGSAPADDGDRLRSLRQGIGRITNRPMLAGNAVQTFENGDAAYPPMLEAIDAARNSVALSSYIFRDDVWGDRFIDALTAAQRRGVAVRVLIDGVGGGWLFSRAYQRLRRNGVPAERFFHSLLPWRMPFINLRSHKKILVLDGAIGFTGGMNIADQNVQATRPKHPVLDTHFRLEGPVVAQLVEDFAQDWAFVSGETLDGDAWFPAIAEAGSALGRVIESGPDDDLEKVEFAVLQALACAQRSIAVMTPYFLPDERMATALALASLRGVEVDVVIPQISDHVLIDWALRANAGPMLVRGIRIWRCPPPFRHSKAMVVDGEWCLIGSSNWDMRSFRLNFELCVEFYDGTLGAQLEAHMRGCRGPALELGALQGRSMPAKLRDAAARLLLPYL